MRESLKNRLFEAAQERAEELGYNFTSIAKNNLINFINNGVDRMKEIEYESTFDRDKTERNLMRLIDKMAENAKEKKLYESLDYSSFSDARASICPLWPFC